MHSGHGYPKLDLSEQLELVQFLEDVLSLVHKASSHKSHPFNLEKTSLKSGGGLRHLLSST